MRSRSDTRRQFALEERRAAFERQVVVHGRLGAASGWAVELAVARLRREGAASVHVDARDTQPTPEGVAALQRCRASASVAL